MFEKPNRYSALRSDKCGEEAIRAAEYRLILTNYPERQEIVLSS